MLEKKKRCFLLTLAPNWKDVSQTKNPAIALAENGIPDTSVGPVLTPNQDTRCREGATHTLG